MQFLQQQVHAYRAKILVLLFLSLLIGAGIILQGYSIVQIVNAVFINNALFADTLPYFSVFLIAIFIRLLAQYTIGRVGGNLAEEVKFNIREQLLEHWSFLSYEKQTTIQTGARVSLLTDTVEQLESYYREYIPQVIKTMIIPLLILIVVFIMHPNSGWIMLITAPFVPLTYIIIGMQTKKKSEEQLDALNRFSGKFLDLLQGLQTIRLFNQSKQQELILQKSNEGFMSRTLSVLKIAFASTLFIELITTLGIGLIALEIGFQMIVFKTLTFAPAFFILTLAPEYYNSLKELGNAFHTGKGSLAAATLIEEQLLEKTEPVQWGQTALSHQPTIRLEKAIFQYSNGKRIGPLSLTIPKNSIVAFIGKTGHGKTTILNMLSSQVELTSGSIYLDDELRKVYKADDWYNEVSFITQHPYIFSGTLRENITMGLNVADVKIFEALKKAQLSDWVQALPNSLDTIFGEGGLGLSGGEKQRVAVARAFLKNPSIVFFDEPTAGLDVLTEKLLIESIKTLSQTATVIIAAHQYKSIRLANTIHIVEDGKIIATGNEEILVNYPLYQQLKMEEKANATPHTNDLD